MRKHSIFLFFLFAFCVKALHAQTLDWGDVFAGNASGAPQIFDTKTDNEGNLVVAGQYGLGNTLNGKALPNYNSFGDEAFLAKFDVKGHLLWMDTSSARNYPIAHIEISKKGDCFFSGSCPATGAPFGARPPIQHAQGFIGKCDRNGKIDWVRKYINYHGGSGFYGGEINYFKVDTSENVYFMGNFPLYPDYMEVGLVKYYASSNSNGPTFLIKFDSGGNFAWINRLRGPSTVFYLFDVDLSGNVYCLSPDSTFYTRTQANALYKYDKSGRFVKRIIMDTVDNSSGFTDLFTDNYGNVCIIGQVSDTLKFLGQINKGNLYDCVAKLDSNLNPVWILYNSSFFGDNESLYYNKNSGEWYISAGYNKKITVAGYSTLNNPDDTFIASNGGFNFYFAKIDSAGHVSWLGNTTYSALYGVSIADDACKDLYISFNNTKSIHYLGFNVNNTAKRTYEGAAIARFSLDSIGFVNQNSPCGLSLKNASSPVYTHFQWYAKDVGDTTVGKLISTTKDLNYLFPHKHKYIITLVASKSGGCTNTVQDTFNVAGSPIAGFNAIDTQGCQYVQFLFSDTSHADTINAAVGQSWSWDFGDSASSGMNSRLTYSQTKRPIVSHVYTQSGTYTVTLVYSNGLCTDTFTSQKKVVIIPAPKPGFTVSDTVGCAPLTVHVTDGSVGAVVGWVYIVHKVIPLPPSKGDSLRSPSFSYSFTSPGQYVIHQYLTGTTGCVTEDSVMVNVTPVFLNTDSTDVADVTVDSLASAAIDIKWAAYPYATNYNLYRYSDRDTSTTVLATQTTDTLYVDNNNIDPNLHTYTYYLKAQDGCGHFTSAGLVGRTIKLTGALDPSLNPKLTWNPYTDWKGGVKDYNIYRKNPDSSFALISSLKDTSYTDAAFISDPIYNECYKVEAIANDTSATSFSNVFCFGNSPQVWVPDVFTPNGDSLNDLFSPVFSGIRSWNINIYSRWGVIVYSYASPSPRPSPLGEGEGWDGNFKGQPAPDGVYVYDLTATDYTGNTVKKEGTVTLIR